MNQSYAAPKQTWFVSFILLIVTFLVYIIFARGQASIVGLLFGYVLGSLPLALFLHKRFISPFFQILWKNLYPNPSVTSIGRILVKFIFHHLQVTVFFLLFYLAPIICFVLLLVEKQIQLTK